MANPQLLLFELKAGRCKETVVARLWEARNVKEGGKLIGIHMVLVNREVHANSGDQLFVSVFLMVWSQLLRHRCENMVPLLNTFCSGIKLELELVYKDQMQCDDAFFSQK
ncbi:hypothetical protein Bca101_017573 [Brassica carinata]